jgi:hypothetical protein
MKFKRFTVTSFGLIAAGGVVWGCSGQSSDCTANADCGAFDGGGSAGSSANGGSAGTANAGGGGTSGGDGLSGASGASAAGEAGADGGAGAPGITCDGTLSPDADACVIANDYGLFVSTAGDDTAGDGTEAKPFATVTKALSATGVGKLNRVYVCADEYLEPGALAIPDRVSIYGGFTCDNGVWAYDTTLKAQLESPTALGAAIDTATHGITLQDLRIDAANAPEDGTGASSFGMTINASKNIVLTRVEIHAGKGGGGKAGTDGLTGADGAASGTAQNGADGSCTSPPATQDGGKAASLVCGSQGGDGGKAYESADPTLSRAGSSGFPFTPNNGGPGGTAATPKGGAGQTGQDGSVGALGAAAAAVGAFSATGYSVASGGSGVVGAPGQGGGGGGASLGTSLCVGASGGAGGMAGCGGGPGTGGTGGGASIALLSWNSSVTIDACTLVATTGGAGGKGGNAHTGGLGKAGGAAGNPDPAQTVAGAGAGGPGGNGGKGGNGAGGTGGPSIALAYSGTRPTDSVIPATLTPGNGGALGPGGEINGSTVLAGHDGQVGMAAPEYSVP